jgi:hypothetical protein
MNYNFLFLIYSMILRLWFKIKEFNMSMKSVIKDMSTGIDGESFDFIRILGMLTIVVALSLSVFVVVWRNATFDMQQFGLGIGLVFAAVAGALKLKESTEPGAPDNPTVPPKG